MARIIKFISVCRERGGGGMNPDEPCRVGVIKEDLDEVNRLVKEILLVKSHYNENEAEMLKGFIRTQMYIAEKIHDILIKY